MKKVIAIIPARYASTRLEGKPLKEIGGHPMIEWVYRRGVRAVGTAVVATDDQRIVEAVQAFGGEVVLTSKAHVSGTSRCIEALEHIEKTTGEHYEIVINLQGDEPFLDPESVRTLISAFEDEHTEIATLVRPFRKDEEVGNPNAPKVVVDVRGGALYFSRSVVPYERNAVDYPYLKHIGIYAFRREALLRLPIASPSLLERCEGLEQLSWLYHGFSVQTRQVCDESLAVDTPEDLERVRRLAANETF